MILFTLGMIWLSQANTSSILFMATGIIGIGYGATLVFMRQRRKTITKCT